MRGKVAVLVAKKLLPFAALGTFVTVYPSGSGRPNASNLNASAGQVVPNMVLAQLGTDGAASIFNSSGAVDLVADVMGYFIS